MAMENPEEMRAKLLSMGFAASQVDEALRERPETLEAAVELIEGTKSSAVLSKSANTDDALATLISSGEVTVEQLADAVYAIIAAYVASTSPPNVSPPPPSKPLPPSPIIFPVRMVQGAGGDWGFLIVIEHLMANGEYIASMYGHVAWDILVKPGDFVKTGQKIGSQGLSTSIENGCYGSHLHFGIGFGPFRRSAKVFTGGPIMVNPPV